MKNILKNTVELFQQIKVDKNIKDNNSFNNFEKTNDVISQDKIDSKGIIDNEINSDKFDNNIKTLRIDQIEIDQEFSKSFFIKPEVLDKIKISMKEKGYDQSQPVVVWENEGKYILIDGHTRRKAAIEIGLLEIFACIKCFANREEAHFYTFKRQVERRNLTPNELLRAIELQPKKKSYDGTGRSDEILAEELGVSASTITHTKYVMKNADEKDIEAIMNEEKSVNQVYNEIKKNKIKNEINKNNEKEGHNNTKETKPTKTQEKPVKKLLVNIDEILAFMAEHNEKSALCLVVEKFKDKLGEDLAVKYLSANRDHLEENIIKEEKL